jgi:hypothetical protein
MKFTNHLFISYAHIDNKRTEENDPGWVDRFDQALKAFLGQAIGDDAKIWRDRKLQGGDVFSEEIVSQLPKSALLVSILSPRYLKSEWCLKEVEEFCKVAEIHGGLVIDNKIRVHRVMLMPLTADLCEKLPGKLKQQLGYLFYKETEGGRFQTLDPRFGDKFKARFNQKVSEMAKDLAEIIRKLEEEENLIRDQCRRSQQVRQSRSSIWRSAVGTGATTGRRFGANSGLQDTRCCPIREHACPRWKWSMWLRWIDCWTGVSFLFT